MGLELGQLIHPFLDPLGSQNLHVKLTQCILNNWGQDLRVDFDMRREHIISYSCGHGKLTV
jgi:hypothetical protein